MKNSILLWILILLSGCDLFELRKHEEPSSFRSSFVQPVVPENVPENLRLSFSEANKENFRKCLGDPDDPDSYLFIPSPELQSQIPFLDQQQEVSSFSNLVLDLLPEEKKITLQFIEPKLVNQIDSAEWQAGYSLFISRSSTDYPSFIDGKMVLNLRKDKQGFWYIYRWRDYSLSDTYCWSKLKWRFVR
ncbi:MAG: hypothetical protein J0L62_13395 [Bacteroidetes bacterium]|nr:hypothetical protein [Bacteroidota bacterium]